jgi:glycerol-3-phosphate dehydrogenase (NAD(P)+)
MPLDHVAIVGAGAWGTALAQAAAAAGRQVTLIARDAETVAAVNALHRNPRFLGEQLLLGGVVAARKLPAADLVILAVPAQASRAALMALPPNRLAGRPVILAAKGLERETLKRQSEILAECAPAAVPFVLSGPSFAADVAAGRPTAVTLAGDDSLLTDRMATALAGPGLRPYASSDRIGVELAGGLKNIYALACGAVEGAELGASARAALLARAYAELTRIVVAMGGEAVTLTGLAGLGDLTLTCTSTQARNYRFGMRLGAGDSAREIAATSPLAEGVTTAPAAQALAHKLGVDAPLIDAVNLVLAGRTRIDRIVAALMARPLKREG